MNTEQTIRAKLTAALSPSYLELVNESDQHAGHFGSPGNGQSHFRLSISSQALKGLNRVEQQRCIYRILADELANGVHALAIQVVNDE